MKGESFVFLLVAFSSFLVGVIKSHDGLIIAAGLFAIAYSIEVFAYRYFKSKKGE